MPLYNSNRAAWDALLSLCPNGLVRFVDLGAGLGGPLAFLAKARPDGFFLGVEASPLTFAIAWLRTLPCRGNCKVRWGSLWNQDLSGFEVVYAFLSPAPMPELWAKAEREMRAGDPLREQHLRGAGTGTGGEDPPAGETGRLSAGLSS